MPDIVRQRPGSANGRPKTGGVLDRIAPIEFQDEGLKILLYGKSGTGKTTFWSTFPGPILACICSGGLRPGELRSVNTPEVRKKVSQVVLHASSEMKEIVDHVKATGKYQTVVLDHISGLQDLTLKEVLQLDELPAQKSWGMARQEDYGASTMMCKEIVRALLNLPCNVVIVAQERAFDEEGASSDVIRPSIGAGVTKSLALWLNPACDYVVQTFLRPKVIQTKKIANGKEVVIKTPAKGVDYCLRTEPHDLYTTKFRMPVVRDSAGKKKELPAVVVDPTYEKIKALIDGKF